MEDMIGKTVMTEEGLMKIINVFFNEEWHEWTIQARPPRMNQIGDPIHTFIPDDIIACPIVEAIYEKIDWCDAKKAHRIFEIDIACGESLEIARRRVQHLVPQRM